MAKNEPVHRIRLGRISAAIWKNTSSNGMDWYRVNITRSWKDGDEWKEAASFDAGELPLVSTAAMMAHTWIWEQRAAQAQANAGKAA